jgi:hypothetical protein
MERLIKKEEATDAIQTVIAQYGYTPEFYGFRRQVGAVIALLKLSHNTVKKSRKQAEGVVKFWLRIYKLYERVKDGTAT